MKPITYTELQKKLAAGNLANVYFVAGEESYLIDNCIKQIEKTADADSLNREVFQAPDVSGNDIVNAVETLPFLSEKRVVVIKSANKLKNADYDAIKHLIENPVNTSCLIIQFPENLKRITSKRKDMYSLCESSDEVICVECKKMYERDVRNFIHNEFKNRNKVISYELVQQMVNDSGTDLLNVSNEIEKICVYIGDKKEVTVEDFSKISGFTKDINIFMLSEYIEQKDLKNALFIYEKMFSNGEDAVSILFVIAGTLRKLLTAKSLIEEKKYSDAETMDVIRIPRFFDFRKKYLANLSKYTLTHLKKSMKELLKADISVKTGKTSAESAVEELILFVCK